MKKIIVLLLAVMLLLSGCGSTSDGDTKTITNITLNGEGTVSAELLSNAKKNDAVIYAKGKSGGVSYMWTIFGRNVSDAKDTVMLADLDVKEDGIDISLRDDIEFEPVLNITVPYTPGIVSAVITDSSGSSLGSVFFSGDEKEMTLNFTLPKGVRELSVKYEIEITDTASDNEEQTSVPEADDYLSSAAKEELRSSGNLSDGTQNGQDRYQTDPVPKGKPLPVEPENAELTGTAMSCTISISCSTILNNMDICDPDKVELVPSDGWILSPETVSFTEGESVFDVLRRVCRDYGIHMEFEFTPIYNSAYIEGIHNLYEFDVGNLSGWMYKVNEWFPNYGCSRYAVCDGDVICWVYTCDLGYDVGGGYAVGG